MKLFLIQTNTKNKEELYRNKKFDSTLFFSNKIVVFSPGPESMTQFIVRTCKTSCLAVSPLCKIKDSPYCGMII